MNAAERVSAYLDALDETARRRRAIGAYEQFGDEVHSFNDHELRRSDLRALLAERDELRALLAKAVGLLNDRPSTEEGA